MSESGGRAEGEEEGGVEGNVTAGAWRWWALSSGAEKNGERARGEVLHNGGGDRYL